VSLNNFASIVDFAASSRALPLPQVQYMIVVTCHASVYTLVLMSLDRFLAVVHPISSISLRTQWNALL
jgi:7 transmembrane receptor (rhodopsin family)